MLKRVLIYASFVRFSHSVFALPFALAGALLASRRVPLTLGRVGWIVVAMVAARSAAMGFNRLVDARFDALNPRTANRETAARARCRGARRSVFVVVASAVFVVRGVARSARCASRCRPSRSAIVFWYSLAKRFTAWTQLFLGLAMAVAPVGGWLAVGGRGGWEPWLLALAIGTWVGGFDVLYACQDLEFDRAHGLRSIPRAVRRPAVAGDFARRCTSSTVACLLALGAGGAARRRSISPASPAWPRCSSTSSRSCRADDLSQVKRAFDLNGYVGILYLLVTAAVAIYVR